MSNLGWQNRRMSKARYTSDLRDEQWNLINHLFKPVPKTGRPRTHSYREILNGIFYVIRTGCQWRNAPQDLPPWSVLYTYYRNWILSGFWINLHDYLRRKLRHAHGRKAKPTAAIIDSQSVKSTECNEIRGFDAGKKINGSKRHLVVDTLGLVLIVMVTGANVQDRDAAQGLLTALFQAYGTIQLVWADSGYAGQLVHWVWQQFRKCLDIVKPVPGKKGFHVQRKRWIVERTFGWLGRWRRLSKNYERKTDTAEALVYISMTHLMLRRLAKS
jgi:putative transposase